MNPLLHTARSTVERHAMFTDSTPVLALVSGGADSVAMSRMLAAGDLGATGPLAVLHVNHLLRAADADADADFVAALCASLGVPCRIERYDVAAWAAEEGLNLEDAGRRVRYRFAEEELDALCDAHGIARRDGRIAVAHTRDDRVETFLMRTITGAGAGGFASIPYLRDRIVRPLLDCDRAALREHLTSLGQLWREDASNSDTTRLRSYVRHELVPDFERANPSFRETLARSIDLLADDDALLSEMAEGFARDFAEVHPGKRVEFERSRMATLDRVMARRTLRCALLATFPEASRIEAEHVEALVDAIGADSFARDLPAGLRAETEYGRLVVSRAGEALCAVAPSLLPIPGTADLGPAGLIIAEQVEPDDLAGTPFSVTIDAGGLDRLVIDAPRPGDRMRPLGMDGSRKLSDLLVDAKVPRRNRAATPVVRDGEKIVWLAGVRMSEGYRIGAETVKAVRLTWEPQGPER